jgi:hypothetical protein
MYVIDMDKWGGGVSLGRLRICILLRERMSRTQGLFLGTAEDITIPALSCGWVELSYILVSTRPESVTVEKTLAPPKLKK